ncbi:GPW/gp25 family protein [Plasticicumulans acidivorans]|uniref:IraD/Gp25-like domain-containing protein n=1 Tax=Plasticicumulans acidivorans TaxID=886464 RepID=A0A317N014_9GAMM|nr:GPW/gp25 family protein [Plasticicumulans acidivorans]PWV65786.1 hypothetical protein C7443_101271 [Plasticicumulans acidivorans]
MAATPVAPPRGWPLGGLSDLAGQQADADAPQPPAAADCFRLAWSSGERAIRESLINILLTRPGERLMRPDFGAGIRDWVHRPNDETSRGLLATVIERAVRRHEPRIALDAVEVVAHPDDPALVGITLRYRILASGARDGLALTLAPER